VSDSAVLPPSPLGFSVYPEPEQNAKEDPDDLERVEEDQDYLNAGPDANAADKRPRSEQGTSPAGSGSAQQAQSPSKRRRPISP